MTSGSHLSRTERVVLANLRSRGVIRHTGPLKSTDPLYRLRNRGLVNISRAQRKGGSLPFRFATPTAP